MPGTTEIDILFENSPGPGPGCFVEVEQTENRHSMNVGEWIERDDGYCVLRLRIHDEDIKGATG